MYPIRFEPMYQSYIWGGRRILEKYHRVSSLEKIAESWEISDRKEGMSIVTNGPYKGKTLAELMLLLKEDLLGEGQSFSTFPFLIKVIDAKETLSIQVHPDRVTAEQLKAEPKSEMWIVLEDSDVYAGLQKGVDEKIFKKGIKTGKVEELLQKHSLKKGEALYIPAGRVHAICQGAFLYEVQQNSNTTYRLYDWGRGRELHLQEGLASIHWDYQEVEPLGFKRLSSDLHHQMLTVFSGPFFSVERIEVFDSLRMGRIPKSFQILFCVEGKGEIEVDGNGENFSPGDSFLIPAVSTSTQVTGKCQFLRTRLPD